MAFLIFALALVVTSLVWKCSTTSLKAGIMHCTSTSIRSHAPVATASSWCMKLPATGAP